MHKFKWNRWSIFKEQSGSDLAAGYPYAEFL